jgi:hypothetical protein
MTDLEPHLQVLRSGGDRDTVYRVAEAARKSLAQTGAKRGRSL